MTSKIGKINLIVILKYAALVFFGIVFMFPLYNTVINAVRSLFSSPAILLPKGFHLKENFTMAITLVPYMQYLVNSLKIVAITVSLAVVINYFMGYAFARINAPGKNILFTIMLAQLMIPGIANLIPQYVLFSQLGIKGTYWIWILTGLGGDTVTAFLFRQFLANIPKEIEDAARIDGCSSLGMLIRIFAPLSKPPIAIVFFGAFNGAWNDAMTPFMYLNSDQFPLATAMMSEGYVLPNIRNFDPLPIYLAAALLFMIPPVIIFFFTQKYLVQGIVTTGMKG